MFCTDRFLHCLIMT